MKQEHEQEQEFNEMVSFFQNYHIKPQPSNQFKLKMYALYKQATKGDVTGEQPKRLDMIASAKFMAWRKLAGLNSSDAKQAYIDETLAFKLKLQNVDQ